MSVSAFAAGAAAAAGSPAAAYQDINASKTISNNGACNERLDADIYVYNDGTIDERHENYGSSAQAEYDSYCTITPTVGFGDDYHIKLTPVSSSSWYDATGSDSLSTWLALTSDRVWHFDFQDCSSNTNQVYTLAISDDGGTTTLSSQTITINMDHDTP